MTTPQRVLLTGAAGRIGAAFARAYPDRYHWRFADRIIPENAQGDWQQLDIADLDACVRACADIDTVVHLAADPSPAADFYGSLLDNNIKGTYNIFAAAHAQGCQRVVYASSVQAVESYPLDTQIQPGMPVRPLNMYGVSKCFGEAVAAHFAHNLGLSSIAVRIGAYSESPPDATTTPRGLSAYLSVRDCHQLLIRCIETPAIPFAIVHGISGNRFPRLDLRETRALLGYAPQDDAFSKVPWPKDQ